MSTGTERADSIEKIEVTRENIEDLRLEYASDDARKAIAEMQIQGVSEYILSRDKEVSLKALKRFVQITLGLTP